MYKQMCWTLLESGFYNAVKKLSLSTATEPDKREKSSPYLKKQ